jgi:hypothetical protein
MPTFLDRGGLKASARVLRRVADGRQFGRHSLRLEVGVASQHPVIAMPADEGRLGRGERQFEKPRDRFMPEIMKAQIG